ncbi:hypothetical protein CSUI_009354 [Cystoisospora suis]|uniref:Transmembrane protein n=1 Tax=Cystoisospora suis TaxID=483139 RepID=A0A2C6JHY6_9APIC|nr:hypothetical protein CSUI_009354 [Cystoisospora suis]
MGGAVDAGRQTGGGLVRRADLRVEMSSASVNGVEERTTIPEGRGGVDYRATRRERMSSRSERRSQARTGERIPVFVSAVLSILLISLGTIHFIACFGPSVLHRFPHRREVSSSTPRKLADGQYSEDLTFVSGGGGEPGSPSLMEPLAGCPEDGVRTFESLRGDAHSDDAGEERGAEGPWWERSRRGIVLYAIPVAFGLVALIFNVAAVLVEDEGVKGVLFEGSFALGGLGMLAGALVGGLKLWRLMRTRRSGALQVWRYLVTRSMDRRRKVLYGLSGTLVLVSALLGVIAFSLGASTVGALSTASLLLQGLCVLAGIAVVVFEYLQLGSGGRASRLPGKRRTERKKDEQRAWWSTG